MPKIANFTSDTLVLKKADSILHKKKISCKQHNSSPKQNIAHSMHNDN
jgi:hypothetical protein